MVYNEQVYKPNTYTDSVITKEMRLIYRTLDRNSRVIQTYSLQKETLASEETLDGLGLLPREEEFYSLKETY